MTMTKSSTKPPKLSSTSSNESSSVVQDVITPVLPSISQRAAMALCEASLLPTVEEVVHDFAGKT